ncbi:type IV pilus modification protein PilV [Endozoicomonas sp. OPT23]|uniref:type IV pilus modification protein PilV n=1 Tax=Endozoicomonas sp. OPT23 TaxID=2072845 RepID=UPI00129A9082|nr:type IV pilus modification protein PilV [Endozoicomonas sp. OPT23]MRI33708.1 type IV pilus modification protein PilV [Endozoicomonas sp. OPT23]
MNRQGNNQGVALIEVLISLLIFSLGVLGLSGLQSEAIRITHDSSQRSHATWLAHEATERMKVNPQAVESGEYQSQSSTASTDIVTYCNSSPPSCIGATCTPTNMARFDVHELMCDSSGLINQQLTIACSATPCITGSMLDITVSWDSRAAVAGLFASRQQLRIRARQ